jgi:hypothetical protein
MIQQSMWVTVPSQYQTSKPNKKGVYKATAFEQDKIKTLLKKTTAWQK